MLQCNCCFVAASHIRYCARARLHLGTNGKFLSLVGLHENMEGVEAELRNVLKKAQKEDLSRDDVTRLLGLKLHSKSKSGLVYLKLKVNIPIDLITEDSILLYFSIQCKTFRKRHQYDIAFYRL